MILLVEIMLASIKFNINFYQILLENFKMWYGFFLDAANVWGVDYDSS